MMYSTCLGILISLFVCLTLAEDKKSSDVLVAEASHEEKWEHHGGNWKKLSNNHGTHKHGHKFDKDDWGEWDKHGSNQHHDNGGHKFDKYGKDDESHNHHGFDGHGSHGRSNWNRGGKKDESEERTNYHDKGQKHHGFKKSYHKTDGGDQKSEHDIFSQGKYHKSYDEEDNWKKYNGEKYHKNHHGKEYFDKNEHGDDFRKFEEGGRNNYQGEDYKKGGKYSDKKWSHKDNNDRHHHSRDETGGRGSSHGKGHFIGHH
ncbi:putative eggshell protein [Centruroides sculpturatus]|uniref:putative eggshell protein n=1 Tax=Centruroides sculpturatus TaxID=218467 RepID=UPI000C6CFAE5|nr:putative eggshell protein [Centruroides sculpturatus]